MDETDLKVLDVMMHDGRISWASLGEALGLSAPAAAERVRKLESAGVILGFTARLDAESLGYELAAFVGVTLDRPDHRPAFLKHIAGLAEVQECHHVAGDYDYLLKVRCRSIRALDRLINDNLKGLRGISRTHTTIVLSTVKETAALPLHDHSTQTTASRIGSRETS